MQPVTGVGRVFDVIEQVKANGAAFRTNFFPVKRNLQQWISRGELFVEVQNGAAFFFRKDHDFWRLYFCAADINSFRRALSDQPSLKTDPIVVDLVGNRGALDELLASLESAGFRRYTQLQRMAQMRRGEESQSVAGDLQVVCAEKADCQAVLSLIESAFDRYAEQLPGFHEIELAIESRQILVVRREGMVGGLLFFETHGYTSMVRYWLAAKQFRASRLGSALMRHYFAAQSAARRFVLWVIADNTDAVQKYQHYGFLPDGLVDYVLANERISQ